MTKLEIENFRSLAPLLLPNLIDLNRLEAVDDYEDYALLTFSLAEPMPIASVLDQFEDQMELKVLYHMATTDATETSQHCCAYANPSFGHMYKLKAQTVASGDVETIYVYIFNSLEVMLESLKEDYARHSQFGHFVSCMEMSRFIADFM